jgi:lysozyme
MQRMSALALNRLTKPWEEFVGYPYDDKVPKRRLPDGRRAYPEWTGGKVTGTITIGYGHTDAAGEPKVVPGMRMTETEGTALLAKDIGPCEAAVRRRVKVPLSQHQFDTLVDFVFNAGEGTLQKSTLLRKLNGGDYDCVPAELMKFTLSRGEHMEGLVHRRQAEINIWRMADEAPATVKEVVPLSPEDNGVEAEDVSCPKADLPASRSALDSKSIAAGATTAATGASLVANGIEQANTAAEPLRQAHETIDQLGLWDQAVAFVTGHPLLIAGALVAVLGAFMAWDRWRHLHEEAH